MIMAYPKDMKALLAVVVMLVLQPVLFASEEAAPTLKQPIAELKLTNGKIFRNVTVVRYGKDSVTLKSDGGIGPLPYSYIPQPERGMMLVERDRPQPTAKTPAKRKIPGQVFITTRGAGSYKFSGVTVTAYPKIQYALASDRAKFLARSGDDDSYQEAWTKQLADISPIARTTTDADGKFTLTLPANESAVFLHCVATRLTSRYVADNLTNFTEIYMWVVPVSEDAKSFDLNGTNYLTFRQ